MENIHDVYADWVQKFNIDFDLSLSASLSLPGRQNSQLLNIESTWTLEEAKIQSSLTSLQEITPTTFITQKF